MATTYVIILFFVWLYKFLFEKLKAFFMTDKGQKYADKLVYVFGGLSFSLWEGIVEKICEGDFGYSLMVKITASVIFMYLATLIEKK